MAKSYGFELRNLVPYSGARGYFKRASAKPQDSLSEKELRGYTDRIMFLMNYNITFFSTLFVFAVKGLEALLRT